MAERWKPLPSLVYKGNAYCLPCALLRFDVDLVVEAVDAGRASSAVPGQKDVAISCVHEPGGAWCCRCEHQLAHMTYTLWEK